MHQVFYHQDRKTRLICVTKSGLWLSVARSGNVTALQRTLIAISSCASQDITGFVQFCRIFFSLDLLGLIPVLYISCTITFCDNQL